MKPRRPKPRNPEARALLTSGAFKQRAVERKDLNPKHLRRLLKERLRKDDPND
jgi:hypothetical protein